MALSIVGFEHTQTPSGGDSFHHRGPPHAAQRLREGSENVICLDVLRAFSRSPETFAALAAEIAAAGDPRLVRPTASAARLLADRAAAGRGARTLAGLPAPGMQGAPMRRFSDPIAAEASCASRIDAPQGRRAFGTLAPGTDVESIIVRAAPPD